MYFRNRKNQKIKFKASAVGQGVTTAFSQYYGTKTSKLRREIQELTQEVVEQFEARAGKNQDKEWYYDEVDEAVEQALVRHGYEQVVEKLHEDEKDERGRLEAGRLETSGPDQNGMGQSKARQGNRARPRKLEIGVANPEWAIVQPGTGKREAWYKATWLAWWKELSHQVRGRDTKGALEAVVRGEIEPLAKTPEEWLAWWKEKMYLAMMEEPEMVYLLARVEMDGARAWLETGNWMEAGGQGSPGGKEVKAGEVKAGETKAGGDNPWEIRYRNGWMEHIQRACPQLASRYKLAELAECLTPDSDYQLSWQGYRKLSNSGALWEVEQEEAPGKGERKDGQAGESDQTKTKAQGDQPPQGLRQSLRLEPPQGLRQSLRLEPPQWMLMRTAMEIAQVENNPEQWAKRWYKSFAALEVIPTTVLMRQAGKVAPRLIEDIAGRVIDNFESTQEAIYQAAVNTKWTGTVSLDWGRVRAKGASINGQRISQGVNAFIRAIDSNLLTQGRQGQEKPVTVSLPIWHLEIEEFIESCGRTTHVQPVVTIPDIFMQRVYDKQPWTLIDPGAGEEGETTEGEPRGEGGEAGYTRMEKMVREQQATAGRPAYRVVMAPVLWRKLITQMAKAGGPFILFTGPGQAGEPFPHTRPSQHGIDGVGGLPLQLPLLKAPGGGQRGSREQGNYRPSMPWVMWPAGAVNVAKVIGADGQVNLKRMQRQVTLALRMLDNVFMLSEKNKKMLSWASAGRAVCLGAVGFRDAIEQAVKIAGEDDEARRQWIKGLAESWAMAVLKAEQELSNERGVASAWHGIEKGGEGRPFNPQAFSRRLRQARQGRLTMELETKIDWQTVEERIRQAGGHRLSGRTLWAPFEEAALVANTSPGGIGNPAWMDEAVDGMGVKRVVPSAAYLHLPRETGRSRGERAGSAWQQTEGLTLAQWKERVYWAGLIRPWVDQGVSVTLDRGTGEQDLQAIVEQAWLTGVDVIRLG